MNAEIDGFYSVYTSGTHGQGFAMLVFMEGKVVGADEYGFVFDGKYSDLSGDNISISLLIKAPPNAPLIQGGATGPQGEESKIDVQVPRDFTSHKFIRIETPRGPVNVRLVKLRAINE